MSHMKARIKLTINGRVCSGRAGQTILEVAQNNGIEIPNLCHNSELKHYGGCSLCVVEAENSPKLLRACATEAQDGQVIYTESERVVRTRKTSIELLMSDHDGDCRGPCVLKCPASVNAQGYVQAIARGDDKEAVRIIKERLPIPASIGRVCPHPCEGGCRRQMVEQSISIAYHGNIVDLLEYLYEKQVHVDLMSDQTSCHVPYDGGYCPQGLSFAERTRMLAEEPEAFRALVDQTLQHHYEMICKFHDRGTYFFDYGNSFLKAVYDSGVKAVCKNGENDLDGFVFPSYVEDILGPCLFDYGYGPFRWCCLSRKPEDLHKTDMAAAEYIRTHNRRYQDYDNYVWVRDAEKNRLVVGTQCRILYQDAMGRMNLALKFNEMVRNGEIGPVILGRDHHDTGGTDAPFRETSNIKDGSNIMAEMATQCYAGNAARGMSYIALHNGGGTGIGRAINGGFGMVLDGSERVDTILRMAMPWDTMVGVARRSWACNEHAMTTAAEYNKLYAGQDHITMPYVADSAVVEQAVAQLER